MNWLNKRSLRMRITLLTGTIILLTSLLLTFFTMYNAQIRLVVPLTAAAVPATAVPGKTLPLKEGVPGKETVPVGGVDRPEKAGNPISPTVGAVSAVAASKRAFDYWSIAGLVVVSAVGMALAFMISGKALKPVYDLNQAISEITTEEHLKQRVPETGANDEVGRLSQSFNNMLDKLEKSFMRQKRFSANVAHELKTPLATISAGIQVLHLSKYPSIAEYEETLSITEKNVNRLRMVVDDLLTLTNESKEDYTDKVDLRKMFEEIFSDLSVPMKEKQIKTELDCQLATLKGKKILLYRACYNLVENAVKFNKPGGSITVQTMQDKGIGKIMISDTGDGIPEDEMDKIFEPFYRVDKSRSRKIAGAGIGLSIVKAIIEKHGWNISVSRLEPAGTAFTLSFKI